ncbi:hypothetical protein N871_05015 [Helicobacter pylori X47-2AL]|uniref:Uncharacterized protein n=1 Tax=Helicobacter pylori X47-2AL TaxID=1386083 RepID=V6L7Q5_HELPX|nr:hypothetical protein N871_05015 [Helicobacter pylori X47-2AL]
MRKENKNMRQTNETEKAPVSLKKSRKRCENKKSDL